MLRVLQDHLEAIYRIEAPDIRRFLLAKDDVKAVLGDSARNADEWVFVREDEEEEALDLGVYIAEEHMQALADLDSPADAVSGRFASFCVATEGISHFLLLIDRARRTEPVSMLELEAQAEVDKYVCARLHLPQRSKEWQQRIFRTCELRKDLSAEEKSRYREAGRLAEGFCAQLQSLPHHGAMLESLRLFWRLSGSQRMEHMRKLAA